MVGNRLTPQPRDSNSHIGYSLANSGDDYVSRHSKAERRRNLRTYPRNRL